MPENKWDKYAVSEPSTTSKWDKYASVEDKAQLQPKIPIQPTQTNVGVGIVAPKEKPSPYLKGLDFKNVTDAIKADKEPKSNSVIGGIYNTIVGAASDLAVAFTPLLIKSSVISAAIFC